MSDIENTDSRQSIQAPIKRKYTRKPKVIIDEPVKEIVKEIVNEPIVTEPTEKPKRKYQRSTSKDSSPIQGLSHSSPVVSEPESVSSNEPVLSESSSSEDDVKPKEKKPRTEKQLQAFARMREARLKKQEELQHLKEFQKEKELLEKEQHKVEKLEQKIVARQSKDCLAIREIKKTQPKKRKEKAVSDDELQHTRISNQVSNIKPILFV